MISEPIGVDRRGEGRAETSITFRLGERRYNPSPTTDDLGAKPMITVRFSDDLRAVPTDDLGAHTYSI